MMEIKVINCGTIRVNADVMHNGLPPEQVIDTLGIDREGNMRLQMNALVILREGRVLLLDPGASEELPEEVIGAYDLRVDTSPEDQLAVQCGIDVGDVSDVVFTHLHFDHCSGAFARQAGRIQKKYPKARYHVLEEHFRYALKPEENEADAFYMKHFVGESDLHWLEDWKEDWLEFRIFHGHTRSMAVPLIRDGRRRLCYLTDLVPLRSFLDEGLSSGYDLDPALALKEKGAFLKELDAETELIFYHGS